jgi:hypothetical protein
MHANFLRRSEAMQNFNCLDRHLYNELTEHIQGRHGLLQNVALSLSFSTSYSKMTFSTSPSSLKEIWYLPDSIVILFVDYSIYFRKRYLVYT